MFIPLGITENGKKFTYEYATLESDTDYYGNEYWTLWAIGHDYEEVLKDAVAKAEKGHGMRIVRRAVGDWEEVDNAS